MVVISSNQAAVYAEHRKIWKSYMKSHPDVECYFIEYMPNLLHPIVTETTIYLPGKESYENIIRKTLDSIEYFTSRKRYDFIVRANLSSVWIFPRLLQYLETAPRQGLYGGEINKNMPIPHPIDYVSGAGIIFTPDVCQLLLRNRRLVYESNVIDDVDIGYALHKLNVSPTFIPRVNVNSPEDIYKEGFQYRVKIAAERDREPAIMRTILSLAARNNSTQ